MGDIKKITEEEIAKASAQQKSRPSGNVDHSPERKKKGKIQWKKLPMEEVAKGTQQAQSNPTYLNGKPALPKKGHPNNPTWSGSGTKAGQKVKGGEKGHGTTKPWAHNAGGSPNSKAPKSQGVVALNVKGNVEKSKNTYLTAVKPTGQPSPSNNANKEKKSNSNADKTSDKSSNHYKNKNSSKQDKSVNSSNSNKAQSKPQQAKQHNGQNQPNAVAAAAKKPVAAVSVNASPFQPSGQSLAYAQTEAYDYQNGYGSYDSYDPMGAYDSYGYENGYYAPPPSLEETAQYARVQIEYYFSTENLLRDMFLRSQLDEAGFVPISLLANFRAVYAVHQDFDSLLIALSQSPTLEVDAENEVVRLRDGWQHWLVPNALGGYGQPRYSKAAAEAAMAAAAANMKNLSMGRMEEPQKETEPTDLHESSSDSATSSDSETADSAHVGRKHVKGSSQPKKQLVTTH